MMVPRLEDCIQTAPDCICLADDYAAARQEPSANQCSREKAPYYGSATKASALIKVLRFARR